MHADEILARLAPEERRWVEEFRDRVREQLGTRVRDLRLFGSKVRGDSREGSDIDLLVLIDGLDHEVRLAIVDLAHEISPWLAAHAFDFERYHAPRSRATGFYQELRKESVRL